MGSSAVNLDTGGCHYADLNGDRHGSFGSITQFVIRKGKKRRSKNMKSFLTDSVFLGVVVSLLTYEFGLWFKRK